MSDKGRTSHGTIAIGTAESGATVTAPNWSVAGTAQPRVAPCTIEVSATGRDLTPGERGVMGRALRKSVKVVQRAK